jgi:hypothetical protein
MKRLQESAPARTFYGKEVLQDNNREDNCEESAGKEDDLVRVQLRRVDVTKAIRKKTSNLS